MIFAGPFSPKLKADAFVASEKVGEGGPGEACRFACDFVVIANGRKDRDFGIWTSGIFW